MFFKKIVLAILRSIHQNRFVNVIKGYNDLAKLPLFGSLGRDTTIIQPFHYGNSKYISIGDNCRIGSNSEFGVVENNGVPGKITIGNNVWMTARCQIFSRIGITIEDQVMIASNVFICDYTHGYSEVTRPYKLQAYEPYAPVVIGEGSWIGQNAVIMYGVTIGKQCIIGANSVVNQSIPDYSIAVGQPARVIKQWDKNLEKWVKFNA